MLLFLLKNVFFLKKHCSQTQNMLWKVCGLYVELIKSCIEIRKMSLFQLISEFRN